MDNQKWLLDQLNEYINQESRFKQRALLKATKDMVREQVKRIDQAQGEIDGRAWNHEKW